MTEGLFLPGYAVGAQRFLPGMEPIGAECGLCSEAPFCPHMGLPLEGPLLAGFSLGADPPSPGLRPVRRARPGVGFPVPQLAQAETARLARPDPFRGPPARPGWRV